MPRRVTRQEQKARTRARILEAAARVFARKGFHDASIEEVAEHAGFTKGAVYSNFEDKEALFLTLMDERAGEELLRITERAGQGDSLQERLRSGQRLVAELIGADRDWCMLSREFWAYAVRDPRLRPRFAAHYERWRAGIAEVMEGQAGDLGFELPAPSDQIASAALALYEGLVLQKLLDPKRFSDEVYASMMMLFIAGVASLGGSSSGRATAAPLAGTRKGG
jgi:AcrR family transcriptional regulator